MNIFVRLVRIEKLQFRRVKYYSVQFEGNEVNEFIDFLNRMEEIDDVKDDLSNLLVWLEEIGEHYGAIKSKFFRNESITADVQGLPPPGRVMKAAELIVQNLRLYCMVLNEHVVFLFNGGIKTAFKAQDCPNVGPYLKQANQIVAGIDLSIKIKEIIWKEDGWDIEFVDNLEIEL